VTGDGKVRSVRGSDVVVALVVALAILGLTVVAVGQLVLVDDGEAAHDAEAAAGVVASGVSVDLGRGLRGVSVAATYVPSVGGSNAVVGPPTAYAPGATAVGFVPEGGELPAGDGPPILSAQDLSHPEVIAAFDRARDSGAPLLTPPVELADGPRSLIVAAGYDPGAVPGPPFTSTDRRDRLAGWVVAAVDLEALTAAHAPEGAVARMEDSITADLPAARADATNEEQVVDIADRRFLVQVDLADHGGVPTTAVLVGVLGVGLAIAAALLYLVARRRQYAAEREADARAAQVRLIGDVAPLVQQSLELAEVLPSVAVQLSDHFQLRGVALSTGSSRGEQTEVFSMGVVPDASVKAVLQPPDHLAAGGTLRLALQRGGRSVALLQVVAGPDLDASDLESLRALSELITAALVNASLYASQQEALARLRELDGLKTVFLGTASHELRTPATAIAGFAGLLSSSWDRFTEEQRRDFVGRIAANARSLSNVVQDLLDFSLLDRGTLHVDLQPVDLGELVAGVVDRLAPAFMEHEVEKVLESAPLVAGDPAGLERITTNLLTNAVKFSPSGTTIRVAVRAAGPDGLLEVCDQGPGVPPDERERVFTRFYRGSGDAVLQTRGVGIGLSVVSEFVARMHGEVNVDDAPGGGARFRVRIPAATASLIEEVADATAP